MAQDFETVKITEIQEASVLEQSAYVIVTQTGCSGDAVFRAPLSLLEEDLKSTAPSVASLPAASAETHGDIVLCDSGDGEKLYVCAKSAEPGTRKTLLRNVRATESYEWVPVGGGSGLPSVTPDDNEKMLIVKDGEWIVADVLSEKQDVLTFDNVPTQGSENPVTSGGVYDAISAVETIPSVTPEDDGKTLVVENGAWEKSDILSKKQNLLTFDDSPVEGSSNPVTSGGVYSVLSNKQDKLVFDSTPTEGSSNPVVSGGVYSALSEKQDSLTFDNSPREGSANPVTSGGVFEAIENIHSLPDASASDNGMILAIEHGAWVKSDALSGKQDTLVFDSEPKQESTNPVRSGGIFSALQNKQDVLSFDSSPTVGSENPVTSGGIYEALGYKQDVLRNVEEVPSPTLSDYFVRLSSSGIAYKSNLPLDSQPTSGSESLITSGGVYSAISSKQDALTFDNEPTSGSDNPVTSDGILTALEDKQDSLSLSSLNEQALTSGDYFIAMDSNGELFRAYSTEKQDSLTSVEADSYNSGDYILFLNSSGHIVKTNNFLTGAFSGLESNQAASLIGLNASGNATKTTYEDILNELISVQDFGQLVYNAIQQYLPT